MKHLKLKKENDGTYTVEYINDSVAFHESIGDNEIHFMELTHDQALEIMTKIATGR